MKKPRSLISWVVVFAAGFLAGVVFSAWKLDTTTTSQPPKIQQANERQQRIAGLEKMVAKAPDNADAWVQLGNDYFDSGNHQKAVEAYQRSLKINPNNADVITDMGISFRRLGQPDQAVASFREALKVDPNHAQALFNMGIVYRDDLRNPAEALKAWETFLEKAGSSPHSVMVRPWVKELKEKVGSSQKPEPPK